MQVEEKTFIACELNRVATQGNEEEDRRYFFSFLFGNKRRRARSESEVRQERQDRSTEDQKKKKKKSLDESGSRIKKKWVFSGGDRVSDRVFWGVNLGGENFTGQGKSREEPWVGSSRLVLIGYSPERERESSKVLSPLQKKIDYLMYLGIYLPQMSELPQVST